MSVIAVVPARGGSKGVPRKNIRILGGKPLIGWTIEAALAARSIDRVVVSTEDAEIASVAAGFAGVEVVKRPPDLATDTAQTLPVVQHAVAAVEAGGTTVSVIVLLQPTTPLRTADDIERGLALLQAPKADSVVSVVDVGGHHPFRMKRIVAGGILVNYIDQGFEDMRPRQHLPPVYIREGSVYIARRSVVMDGHSMVGQSAQALVVPPARSVNIDTELDFVLAEILLNRGAPR